MAKKIFYSRKNYSDICVGKKLILNFLLWYVHMLGWIYVYNLSNFLNFALVKSRDWQLPRPLQKFHHTHRSNPPETKSFHLIAEISPSQSKSQWHAKQTLKTAAACSQTNAFTPTRARNAYNKKLVLHSINVSTSLLLLHLLNYTATKNVENQQTSTTVNRQHDSQRFFNWFYAQNATQRNAIQCNAMQQHTIAACHTCHSHCGGSGATSSQPRATPLARNLATDHIGGQAAKFGGTRPAWLLFHGDQLGGQRSAFTRNLWSFNRRRGKFWRS